MENYTIIKMLKNDELSPSSIHLLWNIAYNQKHNPSQKDIESGKILIEVYGNKSLVEAVSEIEEHEKNVGYTEEEIKRVEKLESIRLT